MSLVVSVVKTPETNLRISLQERRLAGRPVTLKAAAGLRSLAEALPAGTAVPIPREWLLELLGVRPPSRDDEGLPVELTQRQAARLLSVSVSYLRASSCPKHLLPGNGPCGRPLVRYLRDEVLASGTARALSPSRPKAH
jgi:hypothetical protein